MKRWLLFAVRLYPRAWRDRYGDEFAALAEDLRPGWREVADTAAGALRMHLVNAASYWKLAGVMAAVGLIAGGAVSVEMPRRYVSTAMLRFGGDPAQAEARRRWITTELLSRSALAEIIQRPTLDLYKPDRRRMPMEDIVQNMRKDVTIEPAAGDPNTLRVSFAYSDNIKAQLVSDLLARSVARGNDMYNRNYRAAFHEAWPEYAPPPEPQVEVVQDATLPERGSAPNRLPFLAGGIALGLLAAAFLHRPTRTFQYAGFAILGGILAAAAAFLIPDRYTSTAVIRLIPPMAPRALTAMLQPQPLEQEWQQLIARVLDEESLAASIVKPSLALYPGERQRMELPAVVARLRKDLSIRPAGPNTFAISFTYTDRYKAQAFVREMSFRLTETHVREQRALAGDNPILRRAAERKLAANVEVLDPASFPEVPASPNRALIALGGACAGLTAAAARTSRRRSPRLSASL